MNNILILYISIITPLLLLLFILKGEIRRVFIFYIIGSTVCIICGEIDGFILKSSQLSQYFMTINITPLMEEALKALPLLFYAFALRPKDKSLIIAGVSLGVGFAVLETSSAFINNMEAATWSWAIIRGLGAGLLHSLCGLGMAFGLAKMGSLKAASIPILLGTFAITVLFHSTYNILIQSVNQYLGLVLTMFTYAIILLVVLLNKKKGEESPNDKKHV